LATPLSVLRDPENKIGALGGVKIRVGVAVNVSDVISVGKLPNVEISGTPRIKEGNWVGTSLKRKVI